MKTYPHNIWPGWTITKVLGRGSFGTVYEIQREMFGNVETAALKVISIPQNESDIEEMRNDGYDEKSISGVFDGYLESIVSEYSMMRKMNGCSNVVNCDDVRYEKHADGIGWDIYIKMEILSPLTKVLPAYYSEETVIRIAKDICEALVLCSKYNIVHRDIKPQNIFFSSNGDYKLGDFGVAKTVERTMGGTKIGTYKYMAPEVYHNQPYGAAADIYSLGLVLYYLMNERRLPFVPLPPAVPKFKEEEEAKQRRFSGEVLPAPAHGSEALKEIVLKACAYNPKDRYASSQEMLEALTLLSSETHLETPGACAADKNDQDADHTKGPQRNNRVAEQQQETEKTVGPEFAERGVPTPKKRNGSKRTKYVIGLGACAAALLIILVWNTWPRLTNFSGSFNGKIYVSGELATGWTTIDGSRYYFNDDGQAAETGWTTIDGNRYYFNDNGQVATGWKKIDRKQYYFNSDGTLATGWQNIDGKRYYFSESGQAVPGWQTINGKQYYFKMSGQAVTGYQTIVGEQYYFFPDGELYGLGDAYKRVSASINEIEAFRAENKTYSFAELLDLTAGLAEADYESDQRITPDGVTIDIRNESWYTNITAIYKDPETGNIVYGDSFKYTRDRSENTNGATYSHWVSSLAQKKICKISSNSKIEYWCLPEDDYSLFYLTKYVDGYATETFIPKEFYD